MSKKIELLEHEMRLSSKVKTTGHCGKCSEKMEEGVEILDIREVDSDNSKDVSFIVLEYTCRKCGNSFIISFGE